MKQTFLSLIGVLILPLMGWAQTRPPIGTVPMGPDSVLHGKSLELFNGWKLSPAGRQVSISAMPMKMVLSPDGKTLAAVCAGNVDGLALVDVKTEQARQWVVLPRAFNGLVFSLDGKHIYVTGGNSDAIYVFDFDGTQATLAEPIHVGKPANPRQINFLSGMAIHPKTGKLYICNEGTSEVLVVDPQAQVVEARWTTLAHPYACVLGGNQDYLFVSNWGDRSVSALEMKTGKQVARIGVGVRPNEMAVAPDGRLFVCCAGDNTVHVLQTQAPKDNDVDNHTSAAAPPPEEALEIISTSLYDSSPEGSTPDGVAVSPDGKSLFVVNADNNDVMYADIADAKQSRVVGFVPVGWYPSAVATNGKQLFVANGKGLDSAPSAPTTQPSKVPGYVPFYYQLRLLAGSVSVIDPPEPRQLADYTRQVRENSPYTPQQMRLSTLPNESIIPSKVGDPCPIKHVLYIIKENRTYDQVLGDMTDAAGHPIGNGDKSLTMFGQKVTPNQHELSRQYVLLDNLYCNAEVSVDGHAWCDEAMATDYKQRNWITSYSGHGRLPGNSETGSTVAGSLWDACKRHGISFKCYGEGERGVPINNRGTFEGNRDPERVAGWIADLHAAEKSGELPQFMIMSLPEDHTAGTTPGAFTPQAAVASNDVAVGMIVEAASHSPFWKEMAIFIVEDDSQNGPDHVDAHRTTAFVVSPYVKRTTVDSTHYTQVSMVRTMELILGLPPLTQYDAGATPMFNAFTKSPVETPYELIQAKIDLAARNTKKSPGAQASAKMDFDDVDDAPEDELNRILWLACMGPDKPYPTPIHRALFDR